MHIIKSKVEPATTRIKRLLELVSSYSFNTYYMKIIPISFNTYNILEDNRNLICKRNGEKYLIWTHSQAKTSGTKLPEVHGIRKELSPKLRPEKQHAMAKQGITKSHG